MISYHTLGNIKDNQLCKSHNLARNQIDWRYGGCFYGVVILWLRDLTLLILTGVATPHLCNTDRRHLWCSGQVRPAWVEEPVWYISWLILVLGALLSPHVCSWLALWHGAAICCSIVFFDQFILLSFPQMYIGWPQITIMKYNSIHLILYAVFRAAGYIKFCRE